LTDPLPRKMRLFLYMCPRWSGCITRKVNNGVIPTDSKYGSV
jgi:hypothetical protein